MLVQRHKRRGPVQRFGHAGYFVQFYAAQFLDESRDLRGKALRCLRLARIYYLQFFVEGGVVDPVVQAAALEGIMHFARAIGGEHHHRRVLCANGANLRDGDLKV